MKHNKQYILSDGARKENKMKKIIASIITIVMLLSSITVFADGATILINGEVAEIPAEMGSVVEKDWRTFVPVRFVLEYFDYQVVWNNEDQSVLGRNAAGDIFAMQIDNTLLIFKGADGSAKTIIMDVTPFLNETENRTYIPIRFIAEILEYKVGWDGESNTVTLDKK